MAFFMSLVLVGCATTESKTEWLYSQQGIRKDAVDLTVLILKNSEEGLSDSWKREVEKIAEVTDVFHKPDMLWAADRAEIRLSMLKFNNKYEEGVKFRCAYVRDKFAIVRR